MVLEIHSKILHGFRKGARTSSGGIFPANNLPETAPRCQFFQPNSDELARRECDERRKNVFQFPFPFPFPLPSPGGSAVRFCRITCYSSFNPKLLAVQR